MTRSDAAGADPAPTAARRLQAADRVLRRLLRTTAAALLAAVVLLGIAQVASRYLFGSALLWSEELIRLLYTWAILMAAGTADHMRITFVDTLGDGRLARAATALRYCVVLGLLGLLAWGAWQLDQSFGGDRYVALGISKGWYWMAGVTGCLLWGAVQLLDLLVTLTTPRKTP